MPKSAQGFHSHGKESWSLPINTVAWGTPSTSLKCWHTAVIQTILPEIQFPPICDWIEIVAILVDLCFVSFLLLFFCFPKESMD